MTRPTDLPDFKNPPVTEVLLSVQFNDLQSVGAVDIYPIWQLFAERFPHVSEHPPIPPVFETFGDQQVLQLPLFGIAGPGQIPRQLFTAADQTELIQFQRDRFTHNWRKAGTTLPYPRYEAIRASFSSELTMLENWLKGRSMEFVPNQCEIAYVNTILVPDGQDNLLARVFRNWQDTPITTLGGSEASTFRIRYAIRGADNAPIGRLTGEAGDVTTVGGIKAVQLTLLARGYPGSRNLEGVLAFLDYGRSLIVSTFAELTTPEMHEIWGRTV